MIEPKVKDPKWLPKYRIRVNSNGWYRAEIKFWWWPIWCDADMRRHSDYESIEQRIQEKIKLERDVW